jgi:hypothetical protein
MKKWRHDLEAWVKSHPGDADALGWLADAYASDF